MLLAGTGVCSSFKVPEPRWSSTDRQCGSERFDRGPGSSRFLQPAVICKNLFLCNSQKTKFYLLAVRADKKFKTKEISRQINSARLSFASPEYMGEYLDITPGSVSVLGLMNDRGNHVQLLVDEDVLKETYFACHPCINTSSIRLKTADVFGLFTKAINHDYIVVTLGQDGAQS